MGIQHLVKTGLMGVVGQFESTGLESFPRDAPVVCRTHRGLETGSVLCQLDNGDPGRAGNDGQVLRRVGSEDRLMISRLDRYRDKAFFACEKMIRDRKLPGVLVDVEHLFDGQSVFFYFLGEVDPELEALTQELAETYDRKVRFKKFAETLANGCGPTCGTEASNCAAGGCGSCSVASSCKAATVSE